MIDFMKLEASAGVVPIAGALNSDSPALTWKTRVSVLSHGTGPSISNGLACSMSWIWALPETLVIVAVRVTVSPPGTNPEVSEKVTEYAHVKRCGEGGRVVSRASSAEGLPPLPPTVIPDTG